MTGEVGADHLAPAGRLGRGGHRLALLLLQLGDTFGHLQSWPQRLLLWGYAERVQNLLIIASIIAGNKEERM